ncbi:MAG: threonine--tRNA ligase [Thermoplasmatales archaeon]|nr:threonine--tRNA ligase [Thermoplasmatales archaeon]
MRILFIHADFMEYEIKEKAIEKAEETDKKKDRMEDALVSFISVEKDDEAYEVACNEIRNVAMMINTKNIMLYPYAHLSSELAPPEIAIEIMKNMEEELKRDYNVKRAPFGWYKSFKISCKGHPLSELSRHIQCKKEEKGEEVKSEWYILTPQGELIEAEKFDFSNHEELKIFYEYEAFGSRKSEEEPAHIKLMKEHELVGYENASDYGNMKWYPKGYLIKRLLEEKVEEMCLSAGAMEVETPIMYDISHPSLSKYIKKFPARQYVVRGDKGDEFFLRFAACFGQYLMAHEMHISYKNLPIRFFELAKSFRREQHGELAGIKRLRAFTMPDMHTICKDEKQSLEEFKKQFLLSMEWAKLIEIEGEVAMRFVKDFFEKNKDFFVSLVKIWGKPVLVEMWDKKYFYFVTKFEINLNDSVGKSFALSTVQIDVDNPKSFEITYIDENGERKYPYLLHASISGGIDRCVCAILEKEAMKIKKGIKPSFPFWLAPTQVRIIPVNETFLDDCKKIARKIKARIDIDDRDESVSKKIRDAEKEWIPIIIVYGEKEKEGKFRPRYRFECDKEEVSLKDLNLLIKEKMKGFNFRPLSLPVMLSKRARFR